MNKANSLTVFRFLKILPLVFLTGCSTFSWNPLNWFSDDEVDPPRELVAIQREVNLQRRWSVSVGNGQGKNYTELTPAIDGSSIFVASEDGDVVAVVRDSGDVLWRTRLRVNVTGGVGAGEGLVMLGSENADVIALDQASGEELWRTPVSSEVLSAPQSNGDVVVAQTVDGKLVALDHETGVQRWIYETNLPALTFWM